MTYKGNESMLLTLRQVCEMTKMSKSTIYRKVAEGTFPRAIRLGPRTVRWRRWEVEGWIASRPGA